MGEITLFCEEIGGLKFEPSKVNRVEVRRGDVGQWGRDNEVSIARWRRREKKIPPYCIDSQAFSQSWVMYLASFSR